MQTPLVDAITQTCLTAWNSAFLEIGELVLSPEQSSQLSAEIIDPHIKLPEGVVLGGRISRFVNPITGSDIKITVQGVD